MSNSGLGTSSQTFGASGNSNQASQTNPYGPATYDLGQILAQAGALGSQSAYNPNEINAFNQAGNSAMELPNFGPAASQAVSNILQTGGDPTGILRREASNLNPTASGNLDPTQTPGMANVLKTIQNDVSNQVNSQFAGAGRSLSGLNTQTLARGLSQGEAVPLLNQYNQNFSNMLGANQQLGNVQSGAMGNIGNAFNIASASPGLATAAPLTAASAYNSAQLQPFQYLGAESNIVNPIAGLGGTASGSQNTSQSGSGTATNSLLSQIGQGLGLLNPLGSFLGTL